MTMKERELHGYTVGEVQGNKNYPKVVCLGCFDRHYLDTRIIKSYIQRSDFQESTMTDYNAYFHYCPKCKGLFYFLDGKQDIIADKIMLKSIKYYKGRADKWRAA